MTGRKQRKTKRLERGDSVKGKDIKLPGRSQVRSCIASRREVPSEVQAAHELARVSFFSTAYSGVRLANGASNSCPDSCTGGGYSPSSHCSGTDAAAFRCALWSEYHGGRSKSRLLCKVSSKDRNLVAERLNERLSKVAAAFIPSACRLQAGFTREWTILQHYYRSRARSNIGGVNYHLQFPQLTPISRTSRSDKLSGPKGSSEYRVEKLHVM